MFLHSNTVGKTHLYTNYASIKIFKYFFHYLICFCKQLILNVLFNANGLSILLKPTSLLAPQPVKWVLSTKLSTVVVDSLKKPYKTAS